MQDSTKAWWKDTAERLLWSAIQGALSIPIMESLGWIEVTNGEIWKTAAAGGVVGGLAFIKSVAASRLTSGGTSQFGFKTYSYTEAGPGTAGGDIE